MVPEDEEKRQDNTWQTLASAVGVDVFVMGYGRGWRRVSSARIQLVKNNLSRTYFIRLQELRTNQQIVEMALSPQLTYKVVTPGFHAFGEKDPHYGLNFGTNDKTGDAERFRHLVQDILKRITTVHAVMPGPHQPQQYQSKTYVWFSSDVLGTGATGSVYYCRNKKSGELCAVKTFSRLSDMRPLEVQMREFEVLQKLDHPNIIRLLAIEEDTSTRRKVIIMELCDGGSLHTILDDPNSSYGLEQSDFITFLEHITSGMQHLREQQVVHRDIKPGNILRHTTEDGSYVYKLTDFGAARELEEADMQFMSIYGTEEYLHPDVYERGVLRQSTGKKFRAEIDLWSVGATIYHAATGHLPFRPYGGRRNKLTMHQMITQKVPGVIAGVQHYENSEIEWLRELPESCLLSRSMRALLNPLLQGLLESKEDHCWSFDQFFTEALKVTRKVTVYVFDVWSGRLLDVHLDPSACFATLRELIATFTDIPASDQLLLFKYQKFDYLVSDLAQASTYPRTTPHTPVFLYRKNPGHPFSPLVMPEIPKFRAIGTNMAIEEVYAITKESCGHLYYIQRCVERAVLEQRLVTEAVEQYSSIVTRHIERVRDHSLHFRQTVERTCARIAHSDATYRADVELLQKLGSQGGTERELSEIVGDRADQIQEFRSRVEEVCQKCESHYNKSVSTKSLTSRWNSQPSCGEKDKCETRLSFLVRDGREIWEEMAQLKRSRRVVTDDIKYHMNKNRLKDDCGKAVKQISTHCYENHKACHQRVADWFSLVSKVESSVCELETRLNSLVEEERQLAEAQTAIEMAYLARWRDFSPSVRPGSSSSGPMSGSGDRSTNVMAMKKVRQELEELQADHARMIATATKNLEMLNYLENVAEVKMDV